MKIFWYYRAKRFWHTRVYQRGKGAGDEEEVFNISNTKTGKKISPILKFWIPLKILKRPRDWYEEKATIVSMRDKSEMCLNN